jgi:hypothetical protein
MLLMTAKLKAKLAALKHSVNSKGKAPWEDANEFDGNRRKWHEYLRPSDPLLEEAAEEIAMVDWQRRRNRNSLLLYALCAPFGQMVAYHSDQEWTDVASKLLEKRDEDFTKIVAAHRHLEELTKRSVDPKTEKRIKKALANIQSDLRRIANQGDATLEFFMGIGEENAKQAERAVELNAHLHKLITFYLQLEEYAAVQNKLRPSRIEHVNDTESKKSRSKDSDADDGGGD